jgi:adenosylcobinamide-GDP ribazoletransferase
MAASYAAGEWLGGAAVGAVLAVTVSVVATGAFHEDGLADTADAMGGWSREERLRILDDPRHGTYGVVALILALVLRVALLAALTPSAAWAVVPAVHALSRGVAAALMAAVAPAGEHGLAASSVRGLARADGIAGAVIGAVIAVGLLGAWAVPAIGAGALVGAGMAAYARRTLGGIAGDLLGATQQLSELAAFTVAVAAVRHGADVPWW